MEGRRFDALVRATAATPTRRAALALLAGGALAGLGATAARAGYDATCTRFKLAGRRRSDTLPVDDQLRVYLNGNLLWDTGTQADDVGPFAFYARAGDTLRLRATDHQGPYYQLGAPYLHCVERGRGRRRLSGRVRGESGRRLPRDFYDREFTV